MSIRMTDIEAQMRDLDREREEAAAQAARIADLWDWYEQARRGFVSNDGWSSPDAQRACSIELCDARQALEDAGEDVPSEDDLIYEYGLSF